NLAQRSLSMIAKNCAGKIPAPGAFSDADNRLLQATLALLPVCRAAMDRQAIHKAIEAIWQVVADANRYFAAQEPWALRRSNPERMGTVLYVTAEVLRQIAILCQPYVPSAASRLLDQLGTGVGDRHFSALTKEAALQPGTAIATPKPVFPRYVEEAEAAAG
ncbi:MAG TPA: methionine--tRNA ligase, partial [Hyphomicrobiales bacterium]|nr:methionine--tRNA ligase [Hyphomicrobiales bacterium]